MPVSSPGRGQLRQRASRSLIELGENALDGLLLFESVSDERVRFDLGKRAGIHRDFHKFPSLNEIALPVEGAFATNSMLCNCPATSNPVHTCISPVSSNDLPT